LSFIAIHELGSGFTSQKSVKNGIVRQEGREPKELFNKKLVLVMKLDIPLPYVL